MNEPKGFQSQERGAERGGQQNLTSLVRTVIPRLAALILEQQRAKPRPHPKGIFVGGTAAGEREVGGGGLARVSSSYGRTRGHDVDVQGWPGRADMPSDVADLDGRAKSGQRPAAGYGAVFLIDDVVLMPGRHGRRRVRMCVQDVGSRYEVQSI